MLVMLRSTLEQCSVLSDHINGPPMQRQISNHRYANLDLGSKESYINNLYFYKIINHKNKSWKEIGSNLYQIEFCKRFFVDNNNN